MKSTTQPVVITDKNGRVTTVHRRTDKPSPVTAMPKPAVIQSNDIRRDLNERWNLLLGESSYGAELDDRITKEIGKLSDEDLDNLLGALENDMPSKWEIIGTVTNHLAECTGAHRSRWLRRMADNNYSMWETYCANVKELQGNNYTRPSARPVTGTSINILEGIEEYKSRGFYLDPEQENLLAKAASTIYFHSIYKSEISEMLESEEDFLGRESKIRIVSDDLVQHLIGHPEDVDAIHKHLQNPEVKWEAELMHLLRGEGSGSLTTGAL